MDPKVLDENWQMDEQMIRQTDRQQEHIRLISLGNWTENRSSSGYLDNIHILVTNLKKCHVFETISKLVDDILSALNSKGKNKGTLLRFFPAPFFSFLVRMHFYSLDCILNP